MTIALSKTSKLDGIRSWSLQARETCPGSLKSDGSLVAACQGCYAASGNYRFANVKAPRLANRDDWKRDEWVGDMVQALANDRYFRWFDSGDCYALPLARKILEVMRLTPWVSHWMPTRMHKFAKFRATLEAMQALPNVVVRFSSDSVTGETIEGATTSTIVPTPQDAPSNAVVCGAYDRGGKCQGCRACYDRNVATIAYVAHGVSMAKVIRIARAA
jgi:hypothetical protein